jgi:uncharacterized protein (TIGR02996 family)
MTPDDAFLHAMVERPDDDAPRLIYADWLDEHGRPGRAEFIRLQCELTRGPADTPRPARLLARERELLAAHGREWAAEEWPQADVSDIHFERGFAAEVSLREVGLTDADVPVLAASARLGLLRALDLSGNSIGDAGVRALAASPYLVYLTFLDLRGNPFSDEAAQDLGRFPRLMWLMWLGGQAPVQGEGCIGRHAFYFRARGNAWSFGLSENPAIDPSAVEDTSEGTFALEAAYGEMPFAASYMPVRDALAILRRCGQRYRAARGLE